MKDDIVFASAFFLVVVFIFIGYKHEEVVVRNKNIQYQHEIFLKTLGSLSAQGNSLLSPKEYKDIIASLSASDFLFYEDDLLKTLETLEAR